MDHPKIVCASTLCRPFRTGVHITLGTLRGRTKQSERMIEKAGLEVLQRAFSRTAFVYIQSHHSTISSLCCASAKHSNEYAPWVEWQEKASAAAVDGAGALLCETNTLRAFAKLDGAPPPSCTVVIVGSDKRLVAMHCERARAYFYRV